MFLGIPPSRDKDVFSSRYREGSSHMRVFWPASVERIRGRSERHFCFCCFLNLFQLKIYNMPRCHTWGIMCPEPYHIIVSFPLEQRLQTDHCSKNWEILCEIIDFYIFFESMKLYQIWTCVVPQIWHVLLFVTVPNTLMYSLSKPLTFLI